MDNFNIHKYFKNQYITESKPVNELFDFDKYKKLTNKFKKELESKIGDYNTSISMRDYSQDRDDSDPLKGKGFGSIDFYYRGDLPQNDFNRAIKFLKDKGFDIKSESNYYEIEYDGDRAFYPRIKFDFDIAQAEEGLNEGMPTVFDNKSMDELLDIILKYVKDPDDAEEELERFDQGGFDAMSDFVTANLLRDPEYKAWYNKLHSIEEGTCGYSIDGKPADKPAGPELNEEGMDINDPVLVAMRAAKSKKEKALSAPKPTAPKPKKMRISPRAARLVDGFELEDLQRNLEQIYSEMEQEAEPEGGPIADQYADEIDAHEQAIRFIKNQGKEIAQMTYDQAVGKMEEAEYSLDFGELDEILKEQGKSDTEIKEIRSKLLKLSESNKVKAQELTEKLCKKGEAYRKRRMAAGEKSSAYLSGRAVKVCKGQISGRKKKK